MDQSTHEDLQFDLKLATECASAFATSSGLGCTVSDASGEVLFEAGYGCQSCGMCAAAGEPQGRCTAAHIYGMAEAERFGGKYIYFCPMGLTCFVSPIVGQWGSSAKITVGPLLMVDTEDYLAMDIHSRGINAEQLAGVYEVLPHIPRVSPDQVNALSTLLFLSVGFMNNVSEASRMLKTQDSDLIQGQVSAYIAQLKNEQPHTRYPLEVEHRLVESIRGGDADDARARLNEILGYILLGGGGDLLRIKVRVHELLAQISRAAVDAGASPEAAFNLSCEFFQKAQTVADIDGLCFLITDIMVRLIGSVFAQSDIRHVDVMHKALDYIRSNYMRKLSLDEVAREVYLSPSYFSRLFKKEMGCTFNTYLNRYRIDKSKTLVLKNLRLADVAVMVGFEDQSYFTKVFKKMCGVAPNRYRESGGRA